MRSEQIGLYVNRKLQKCAEVNCEDYETYPLADEFEFETMTEWIGDNLSMVHIYPFIRRLDSGEFYMEFYIWDSIVYPDYSELVYSRFVLRDGYRLPDKREDAFLRYLGNDFIVDGDRVNWLGRLVKQHFPQWNFTLYESAGQAFEHIYYASSRTGVKEILYKAGLGNTAYQLDKVVSYNFLGTSPQRVLGHEIPLRLIRIMNQEPFVKCLFDEMSIADSVSAYRMYSGFIGKKLPTTGQWLYLMELWKENGFFGGHPFIRTIYDRLEDCDWHMHRCECTIELYRRFLVLRDNVQSLKVVNVPRVSDLWDRIDDLETVLDYEREGGCYEDAFCKRKRSSNYEYMGTQYSVIMPGSSKDFIQEARSQRNCILNYEIDHAMGRTTILFVRKNKALDESFVTMEVRGGSIVQAKGKFNKKPDKEVMEFLEDYSKVMELKMRL